MESLSSSLKKKATEHHYRAEVMIAGEQLRLRLHDGKLVKDRRYHLRTYPNCFVAKELTDWLIEHKEAPDRETAIRLLQKLMDHYIIHHGVCFRQFMSTLTDKICDEHSDYKDAKLLYRFRKDDGTFPLSKDVKVFLRGQSLYEKYVSPPLALGHWPCALLAAGSHSSAFPSLHSLLSPWEMLLPEPWHSCRTTLGMGQEFHYELMDASKGSSPRAGSGIWHREVPEPIQWPFPALFQPPPSHARTVAGSPKVALKASPPWGRVAILGVSLRQMCIPGALLSIRSSGRGMGEHPGSLTAEPAAPSRGDAGLALTGCQWSTCRLKPTSPLRLDCLPCVTYTQPLAWLSLSSLAELTAQLVLLELLPRCDEDLQRCPTAAPCSSLPSRCSPAGMFWLRCFARFPGPCFTRLQLPWALAGMFGITAALSHLCARLVSVEESILKVREENSVKYQRTFLGSEMIDWLIQEGEVENRQEAVELGRALLEHGIIQHVSNRHHFFDSDILYHFWINFRRRRRLTELLNENSSRALSESPDSPFCLRKLNPEPGNTSFLSVQTNKEIKVVSAVRRSSITSLSGNSNAYFTAPPTLVFPPVAECNPKSVLKRPVTNEELLSPGAPYVKKTLTIVGDAVGWGFVVRGGRPCHIQAVDPGGPAAAAGMKVCQFVFSVNGVYVLHLDYQTISSLIMTGPRTLVMEVMEAIE
ncbi:hypothetical protein IHE44_0004645 [Lamprotornis superbus]|uniref:DEP domain-containing mTOR-interacting protein n=1 Tax=Lamprotornis superbus TaxID=245042 RepID=A0A835NZ89_9PASS|nr:hypothetical protein IHE44_0004645 [Lamprotornis superbus]